MSEPERIELVIQPNGESEPWQLRLGGWCGGEDGISICLRGDAALLTRVQVVALREFLERCEAQLAKGKWAFTSGVELKWMPNETN